jgi:hypothetical protein
MRIAAAWAAMLGVLGSAVWSARAEASPNNTKTASAASAASAAPAALPRFEILPGASREISHAASASRDTAALGVIIVPRAVLTAGGDFGLCAIRGEGLTFRPGFFGMLELESEGETKRFLPLPMGDTTFWRGLYGYSAAIAFDALAKRWLGERGALEATIAFRHESEHFTGSNDGPTTEAYAGLPHIGDFILVDAALRAPFGRFEVETRVQYKAFVIRDDERAPYRHAPGADLIARFKAWPFLHFFSSTFAEFLISKDITEDAFFFRNLTGIVLPGRAGDMYIYAATDVGHGKGLLVHRKEASLGGGIRIALE